jgi:hypothetical protein
MLNPLRSFRWFLFAIGIFLLVSSSGMPKPAHAAAEPPFRTLLPAAIKKNAFGGNGIVHGTVLNASVSGLVVPNVNVCFESICDVSDEDGFYEIETVPSGMRTLNASTDGFVSSDQSVNVIANTENNQDIALVPEVVEYDVSYRILVTWDPQACWPDPDGPYDCEETYKGWWNDLDAHLWEFEIGVPISYHVGYYTHYNPANDTIEPWLDKGDPYLFPYAFMERDAQLGYGPETIAIVPGVSSNHYYGVLNFNQGQPHVPSIAHTGAVVRLYGITGLMRTYHVPADQGDQNFWYVFSLNGQTGEVTDYNCIIDYTDDTPACPP